VTTREQMDYRYRVLYHIVSREHPVPCRGVAYRTLSTPEGHPLGVKTDQWFKTVERALVAMRRGDRNVPTDCVIPHQWISESGRQPAVPATWDSAEDPLRELAESFRRSLWTDSDVHVEVWCEAASMMDVIGEVTDELDVTLRPSEGFGSEGALWRAAQAINAIGRETYIYQVGDFDPYGLELWDAIIERLRELTTVKIHFERIAVTEADRDANMALTHKAKPPKNNNASVITRMLKHTNKYGDDVFEVEALPTPITRARVREAIMRHIDPAHIAAMREEEERARGVFESLAGVMRDWEDGTLPNSDS
jgi:hypothetical protein